MHKVEDLKNEIVKSAKIDKALLPALKEAKQRVQVLSDKLVIYQKQGKDLETQIVNIGAEIRNELATGGESAEKTIQKRSVFREKKTELESLAKEVEEVMLPAAIAEVSTAEKRLFEALQEAVMIRRNALNVELEDVLRVVEADLESWTQAVWAVQGEFVPTSSFSGTTVMLTNRTIRRALGI